MGLRSLSAWFVALVRARSRSGARRSRRSARSMRRRPGAWLRPVAGAGRAPVRRAPLALRRRASRCRLRRAAGHAGAGRRTPARSRSPAPSPARCTSWSRTQAGCARRTSFLATVAVRRGQRVARGDVLGTDGWRRPATTPACCTSGCGSATATSTRWRCSSPADLTRLIRLVPVDAPAAGRARPAGGRAPVARRVAAPPAGRDRSRHARGALGSASTRSATRSNDLAAVAGVLIAPARHADGGARGHRELAVARLDRVTDRRRRHGAWRERLLAWARSRQDCESDTKPPSSGGGSGHLALTVAGINSSTDRATGTALPLDTHRLGYRDGEVRSFSYAPGGGPYDAGDTTGDLRAPRSTRSEPSCARCNASIPVARSISSRTRRAGS